MRSQCSRKSPHHTVSTLCAVEEVHGLLLAWLSGGHIAVLGQNLWVRNTGLLAEARDTSAMPEGDEESGGGRAEYVAGL